jgi:VanZ family protein
VVVNLLVLYWPRVVSGGGIPFADKLVHIVIFGLVAATGLCARLPVAWLVGVLVAQAVVSELVQHWFLANRTGDPRDVAADLIGVAVGVLVGRRLAAATGVDSSRSRGSLSP